MARPSKFNPQRAEEICNRLRTGCSRKASAESAGVSYDCFLDWVQAGQRAAELEDKFEPRTAEQETFFQFFRAVTRAEAEMEVRNAALISKAAGEHDTRKVVRTSKTVIKVKKTRHPDGTVVEEPVALEDVRETITEGREFDWHAALELLKRRRPADWGDRKQIDVRTLTDDQLLGLLADEVADSEGETPEGEDSEGETPEGPAGETGGRGAPAGSEPAGDDG